MKKCIPIILSEYCNTEPIEAIDKEDVFEARTQSLLTIFSSSLKTLCLTYNFSTIDSITKPLSFKVLKSEE